MPRMTLEVVGPAGRVLHLESLDAITVRRRETGREFGSRVSVMKGHAPLLMQMQPCDIEYTGPGGPGAFHAERALVEVWQGTVTVALT